MYNLRYHIASLVSVFLALAVGLVLGGLAVGRGMVDRQQTALVEGLQAEFSQLRDENRELQAENRLYASFSKAMVDDWTADRLSGRTVVVVTNTGRDDGLAAVRQAVESAGGNVAVATMTEPEFGMQSPDGAATLASLAPDPEDVESSVAASLAAEWSQPGQERSMTEALVESGLLRLEGLTPELAASGLVTIAAPQGKSDPMAIRLAERFAAQRGIAIGGQTRRVDTGVAAAAADAGLPALDTLGTEVGRYSLVALLTGAEGGYYGLASRARAPYPNPTAE